MSPVLFAIYMQYVTSALQRGNIHNRDEPLLLYADDMVLWAETEEELIKKASIVHKALGELNLKINPSKTELQHNDFAKSKVGQFLTVGSESGRAVEIQYQPTTKPIRYLGAWTTCNKNTDYGLELLKEKCSIG